MASRNGFYHTGFLSYSQVLFDGTHCNYKFFIDTHSIGSGELMRQSGEHLFGLCQRGGHRLCFVVAHEAAVHSLEQGARVADVTPTAPLVP